MRHERQSIKHQRRLARLSEAQNHRCCYCGVRTIMGHKQLKPTIEHVLPREMGGTRNYYNIVMACGKCNSTRFIQDPTEWMALCEVAYTHKMSPFAYHKYLQSIINHVILKHMCLYTCLLYTSDAADE